MFCQVQGCQGRHGAGTPISGMSREQREQREAAREQYQESRRRAAQMRASVQRGRVFGFGA